MHVIEGILEMDIGTENSLETLQIPGCQSFKKFDVALNDMLCGDHLINLSMKRK
jgi:hypothetical protein